MQTKKAGSKGPQKTLIKATALLELSSLLIEIEKQVSLSGENEEPLLNLLFTNIAELVSRVLTCFYGRLFLIDQKKVGGIVLFSRGGFDSKGDLGDGIFFFCCFGYTLCLIFFFFFFFFTSSPNVG